MANETTEQVTNGTDAATDIDFAEVAAGLGVTLKTAEPEAKQEDAAPEQKAADQPEAEETKPEATDPEEESPEPEKEDAEEESEETAEEDDAKDGEEGEEESAPESKVQKRIDKLTAQRHELIEERDTLKAQLDALQQQVAAKPPVVTLDPENPLSSFTDPEALKQHLAVTQDVLDWADENRDGGTMKVDGEEKFYDAEAVKGIRAHAKKILRAAPLQEQYLAERERTLPETKAFYPEFFQPGSSAHSILQATVKQFPWIVKIPQWELIVGDALKGQELRMARYEQMQKRASAKPSDKSPAKAEAATVKVPTPKPNASPKVSSSSAVMRQKADAALKAGGNRDALEAFMADLV